MEIKKSKNAQIENLRGTWLLMGFVAVLAFLFVAFEWAHYDKQVDLSSGINEPVFVEDMVPITFAAPTPPPPPPPAPTIIEQLVVVDNETEVNTLVNVDSEDFNNKGVEVGYVPIIEDEPEIVEDVIFDVVEEMPSFREGQAALMQYLAKNMKYPLIPQEQGIQGKVIIQFVVDKDGSIADPVVVRSVDPYLDKEALRVVSGMPKWNPGKQRNKPVRVKFTVPVTFRLQ